MTAAADGDVLVIGAGPAGSAAAYACARRGLDVRLVDHEDRFRDKVCGCCVNRDAMQLLSESGLWEAVAPLAVERLSSMLLHAGGRSMRVAISGGAAISRRALDAALADAARRAGAVVTYRTSAHVRPDGTVKLKDETGTRTVCPRCVIVADGLGGRSLDGHSGFRVDARPAARIGLGGLLPRSAAVPAGEIVMACGRSGYVGMVRLEDGRTDVAAAVDPDAMGPDPARFISELLSEAGLDPPAGLGEARWRGTARLTRSRTPVACEGVFVVGDAAGYVEPFTGQGIAWALRSGLAVAEFAQQAAECWRDTIGRAWAERYDLRVRRRQAACRVIAAALRRPWLTQAAVHLASIIPLATRPIVHHLTHHLTHPA